MFAGEAGLHLASGSLPLGQHRQTTIHTDTHTDSHTVGRTCKLQRAVIQWFLRWPTSEVCPCDNPNFPSRATFYKTSKEGLDFAFICPSTFSFSLCLDNGEKQKGLFQSDGKLIRACAISQTLPLWFPCPLLLDNRNRLVCKGWWAWKCWWQMYFHFPSVFLNCS